MLLFIKPLMYPAEFDKHNYGQDSEHQSMLLGHLTLLHTESNKSMNKDIIFSKQDNYLLVSISDAVITPTRAQEILTQIE